MVCWGFLCFADFIIRGFRVGLGLQGIAQCDCVFVGEWVADCDCVQSTGDWEGVNDVVQGAGFHDVMLFGLLGSFRTWRKVGAKSEWWQVEKCAFFAYREKRVSRFALSMSK